MTLQEFYDQVGGSYEDTLRRLPSEAFIRKFLLKFLDDPSFSQLSDAVEHADWPTAFRAAHTLKGVAQNLGLGRLHMAAAALTDALRSGAPLTDPALFLAVQEAREAAVAAITSL